jgi:dTDP-glucose pyrophosphorylase
LSVEILSKLVIAGDATFRDAMAAINDNYREVVLVEEAGGRIAGVITDGDIRRGLLSGLSLAAPAALVMSRQFISVGSEAQRAEVLDLMKALRIRQVPVLDADGRLLGIHFLEEIIGAGTIENIAVIMAGGRGSRLRPMTENCPKPMIMVAGRPILERVVLHLVGCGVRQIYLSINYLGQVIEKHFGDGAGFGCHIEYLRESKELGTGGALGLLPAKPKHPLLVLNGDQITRIDIRRFLARHYEAGASATIAVGSYQHEVPFGVVHEKDGWMTRIEEKPSLTMLVNRGMYVLEPDVFDIVPKDGSFPITDLFDRIIEQGQGVATYFSDEEWLDVGRPADLLKAHGIS